MTGPLNRAVGVSAASPRTVSAPPKRPQSVPPKPMPARVWKASQQWRSGSDAFQAIAEQGGAGTTVRVYRSRGGGTWEQVGALSLFESERAGVTAALKDLLAQLG